MTNSNFRSTSAPDFYFRSNNEVGLSSFSSKSYNLIPHKGENIRQCKFSPLGKYFAFNKIGEKGDNNDGFYILNLSDMKIIFTLESPIIDFEFSPQETYILTFERFKTGDNVKIFKILSSPEISPTTPLLSFQHKNQETWKVKWTEDESYCAKLIGSQVCFYSSAAGFKNIHSKLAVLHGIKSFSISPGKNPSVAAFVPEKNGAPAIVRLYGLLSFNYPLSNKTFYKADNITFKWNTIGTNVLVLTQTDTDNSGSSYYGETNLYYLSAVGNYGIFSCFF
jgi:translation initiation factor 2A